MGQGKDLGYSPNFIAPAFRYNYTPERISPVPTLDLMYLLKGETGWKILHTPPQRVQRSKK